VELDKYKELYDLAREATGQTERRFDTVESKAAAYLSVLTALVGAGGFFAKWVADELLPPKQFLDWCLVGLAVATLAFLSAAWLLVFGALRVSRIRVLALGQDTLEYFRQNTLVDIYYAMAKGFADAWAVNNDVNAKKLRKLTFAYRIIIVLVALVLLFSVLYGVRAWIGKPS
jgi:hypothetical protein